MGIDILTNACQEVMIPKWISYKIEILFQSIVNFVLGKVFILHNSELKKNRMSIISQFIKRKKRKT